MVAVDEIKVKLEVWMKKNPKIFKSEVWKELETKTTLPGPYLVVIVLILALLLVLLIGGRNLLSNLIGFLFPATCSLQAIKTPNKTANMQWISYWMVFMFSKIVERLLGPIFRLIPLFFLIKMFFYVWCYHPKTKGATVIYEALVQPHILPLLGFKVTKKPSKTVGSTAAKETKATSSDLASDSNSAGKLEVKVKEGKDLTVMDLFSGSTSAYCVLKLLPASGKQAQGVEHINFKTTCKHKTLNPVWNEPVAMDGIVSLDSTLLVTVKNKQAVGQDDFIGCVKIPLSQIGDSSQDAWYTLTDPENLNTKGVQGELHLSLNLQKKAS